MEQQNGTNTTDITENTSVLGSSVTIFQVNPIFKWYLGISGFCFGALSLFFGGVAVLGLMGAIAEESQNETIAVIFLMLLGLVLIVIGGFVSRKGTNYLFVFLSGIVPGLMISIGWFFVYGSIDTIKGRGGLARERMKYTIVLTLTNLLYLFMIYSLIKYYMEFHR